MGFFDEKIGKTIDKFAKRAKDTVQKEMGKDLTKQVNTVIKVAQVGGLIFGVAAGLNLLSGGGGHVPKVNANTVKSAADGVRDIYYVTNHYHYTSDGVKRRVNYAHVTRANSGYRESR